MLIAVLAEAKKRHPKSSVVFVNRFGRLLNDNTIRLNYNKAFEAAGLPWRATHILRHTNATLAIKELRAEAVQVNHGHATNKETLGYAKIHAVVNNSVPETVAAMLQNDHVQNHVHYPQSPNTLN